MRSLALALICYCVLAVVRPSLTMKEAPSSAPMQSSSVNLEVDSEVEPESILQGLELQGVPEKRAYTYVSEYKRLPIYNFGLGKRWGGNTVDTEDKRARLYSFGLGKRARPYNFGLGKRGGESVSGSFPFRSEDQGDEYVQEFSHEPLEDYIEKRSRLYSFGLGKRTPGVEQRGEYGQRFNFGLGKRPSEDFGHRYKFGLGKRRLSLNDDQLDDGIEEQQPVAS